MGRLSLRPWMVHAAFLAATATLVGLQVGAVVGLKLQGLTGGDPRPALRALGERSGPRDFHLASERNLFGEPVLREDIVLDDLTPPVEEAPPEVPDIDTLPDTELPLKLVGTSVFGERSQCLASILDTQDKSSTEVFAPRVCGPPPCEQLPHEARLIDVGVEEVILYNEAEKRYERLLLNPEVPAKGAKVAREKKPPEPPKRKGPAGSDLEVVEVSPGHFRIPRSAANEALAMLPTFGRQVRVEPTPEGFKLGWIQKGSVLSKLGVEKGDVLKAVNGYDVTSMEGAMTAFSKLKEGDRFSLDVVRGSKKMTLEYELH